MRRNNPFSESSTSILRARIYRIWIEIICDRIWDTVIYSILFIAGGVVAGGHSDYLDNSQPRDHEKPQDWREPLRPQDLVPPHQGDPGDGQGVVHVPDQHWPHEESSRFSRCCWWVRLKYCILSYWSYWRINIYFSKTSVLGLGASRYSFILLNPSWIYSEFGRPS